LIPNPLLILSPPVDLAPLVGAWLRTLADVLPWLLGAAFFATLRVALQRSHPERTPVDSDGGKSRTRLEPLLARAETLATSAGVFEVACRAAFTAILLRAIVREQGGQLGWPQLGLTVVLAVPALLFVCDALATALALRRGDEILRAALPAFHVFQLPLRWIVRGFEATRRALLRVVGLDPNPAASRRIVEGLREVIEEAEISGDLDETEREIIGNVMEFRDVDVAAVMTPRTEIHGVEASEGLAAAARVLAESGHSRIPVFEGSLDTVIGIITARDVVQAAAEKGLDDESLRPWLRPAYFVPETKPISELLAEMRREKTKLAIVLDEYGGTAGLVTLGDILREIVGDIHDEFDVPRPLRVRKLPDGSAEVDASLHVSEVNEELGLEIPEGEDYETLAGFVLSELGRFPKRGESFTSNGVEYVVLDASDRRVLKVLIRAPRRAVVA
jgi:CBS domain containing-hemolysin-like protein